MSYDVFKSVSPIRRQPVLLWEETEDTLRQICVQPEDA